jgi:hypothetical protein
VLARIISWFKPVESDPFEWIDNMSKYEDTDVFLHKDRMYVPCTCGKYAHRHMRMIHMAC